MVLVKSVRLRENKVACSSKLAMGTAERPWEAFGNMAVGRVGEVTFHGISNPSEKLSTREGSLPSHPQGSPELVLRRWHFSPVHSATAGESM